MWPENYAVRNVAATFRDNGRAGKRGTRRILPAPVDEWVAGDSGDRKFADVRRRKEKGTDVKSRGNSETSRVQLTLSVVFRRS